ncbi:shikimate dehydrogenase [Clostridium sp. BJN0001]|uniref:shikimate dehydrogenase n=1 Tax=Clostridium sp. BJN0001 TaxID=2930219 RepID=UPI001FD14800|nr:shikimate dehydrogenase [Clostridium sp. BJN0001]
MDFYGLFGEKLGHSLSPEIHNTFFKICNIEGAYKLFEVEKENLKDAVLGLKALKIKGANVTIPYKVEIMKYLDFISDEAKKIKAVNTVCLKDGKLYGYNTDYFGFSDIIRKNNIDIDKKTAMVLGNGGACKAVITYLLDNNIEKVYLISRRKNTENDFDDNRVILKTYDEISDIKGKVLINTTPVGMYPNCGKSVVDEDIIRNFDVLIDIVYNPAETEFLKIGKKLNKKVYGGMTMLIGQAIKSEEIWQEKEFSDSYVENLYKKFKDRF